jgi:dihydroorotate dehydrogenase (NAD+) catalytic subunit
MKSSSSKRIDLSLCLGNLTLRNPVLLASGTCGYGAELTALLRMERLGGIITKTITPRPRAGNPPPRLAETPSGLLNSIGLENVGLNRFVEEQAPKLCELPTAVIVSVGGESVDEFVRLAEGLIGVKPVEGLELNISCPNVERGMAFGSDPSLAEDVVTACRKVWKDALIIKLTPNAADMGSVAKACENAGADAVTVSNTYLGMKIDIGRRRSALTRPCGGLSGPAIRPLAVARVWEVSRAVGIPVIGSGGVCTADDALEHIIAGASAVQVGTGTFVDPAAAEKVVEGLEVYCRTHGISHLRELVGCLETEDDH